MHTPKVVRDGGNLLALYKNTQLQLLPFLQTMCMKTSVKSDFHSYQPFSQHCSTVSFSKKILSLQVQSNSKLHANKKQEIHFFCCFLTI